MGAPKRKVVIASRNVDKARELAELMAELPFEVATAADYEGLPEVIEDGTTIEGNATRKALVTAAYTGEIAVADDTSLQVRELNELPDIFAARFSGPDATYASNCDLLLELMKGVPDGSRQARFATACAWVDPRPEGLPGPVSPPARSRWLHNPWAAMGRTLAADDPVWTDLLDRSDTWDEYKTALSTNLVSWGHDKARAAEVVARLLEGAGAPGPVPAGMIKLPDPRIWATPDRRGDKSPTNAVPVGLPEDAPGRSHWKGHFFQITARGRLLGRITDQRLGSLGFGYDPVFRPEVQARTLAELEPAAKNAISHRGRALRRLMAAVKQAYGAA